MSSMIFQFMRNHGWYYDQFRKVWVKGFWQLTEKQIKEYRDNNKLEEIVKMKDQNGK